MCRYQKEPIPDNNYLYQRVHSTFVNDGKLNPGVFSDHQGAMSTDWSKYSTPEKSRLRAKQPEKNGIIQLMAGKIREIPNQQIEHEPENDNQAHTNIYGEKDTEVRLKYLRRYSWVIKI